MMNVKNTNRSLVMKMLRIGGLVFGCIAALILLSTIVISLFFKNQVKQAFENEINRQITTEFRVDGKIRLSLLKNFPNASITFNDVVISGSLPGEGQQFIAASEVSVVINLWKMLRGKYDIRKILIRQADIHMLTDRDGNTNYNILTGSDAQEPSAQTSGIDLQLKKALITDSYFTLIDQQKKTGFFATFEKAAIGGSYQDDELDVWIDMHLHSDSITSGEMVFLQDKPIETAMTMNIQPATGYYAINAPSITLGNDEFQLAGSIMEIKDGYRIDLNTKGNDIGIGSLLAMVPNLGKGPIAEFDSKGNLLFDLSIIGDLTQDESPSINAKFELEDGRIIHSKLKKDFKDVTFEGSFTNGNGHSASTAKLDISEFSATFDNQPLKFRLSLLNLKDPFIRFEIDSRLDIESIMPLFAVEDMSNFEGIIAMEDVKISGRTSTILKPDEANQWASSGNISLHDIGFTYGGQSFNTINGTLGLRFKTLAIEDLHLETEESDLTIKGAIRDFPGLLAGYFQTDSKPILKADLLLQSHRLNLDEIKFESTATDEHEKPEIQSKIQENKLGWFSRTDGHIEAEIKSFHFREFDALNLYADFNLSPQNILINALNFEAMDGRVESSGEIKVLDNEILQMKNNIVCHRLDIRQLFESCENFDQDYITDDHLRGQLLSVINASMRWDRALHFMEDEFMLTAGVEILDGELVNFEPLEDLGSFVKVKELKHIKFRKLQNDIKIKNRTVEIPGMVIQSTALNMAVAGKHTFDNDIQYYFKINLMDVIARKFKFGKMDLDEVDRDVNGIVNLYVVMKGTVNDYTFKTDKKLVKQQLNLHKSTDEPVLEFIWDDKPSLPKPGKKPGNSDEKEELEFIEWDTDTIGGRR